jgi:hypothetical protein
MGAAASRTPAGGLILALLCAVAFTGTAWADVYIWRDPQTGARRMSNVPPPWVRDNTRGPKVEILRDGKPISAEAASANPQAPAEPSARQRAAGEAAAAASGRPVVKPPPEVVSPSQPVPEDD